MMNKTRIKERKLKNCKGSLATVSRISPRREVVSETSFQRIRACHEEKILPGEIRWFGTLKDGVTETQWRSKVNSPWRKYLV